MSAPSAAANAADRQVADRQEQERADQLGQIRACCHPNPPVVRPRGAVLAPRVPTASTSVQPVARGAQQQGVAPGPAQDLEQLEPIDRRDEVRADRDAPWRSSSTASASGSGSSVNAAAIRSASSSLPISPNGTNGRRGRSRAVSGRAVGSGISPATVSAIEAGRWAWATAPMSGRPRGRRGGSPGPRTGQAGRRPCVAARRGRATRRRGHRRRARPCAARVGVTSEPVVVEPDREVALAGGDQPASAEPPPRREDGIGRLGEVHPAMLRQRQPRSRRPASEPGSRRRPRARRTGPARSRRRCRSRRR